MCVRSHDCYACYRRYPAVKILQGFRKIGESRIAERLSAWLREETSTEKLALTLALGLVLGVLPVFGLPTVLCGAAAAIWRLNFPALQLINSLAYPLQIALLWPFARLGGILFGEQLRGAPDLSRLALYTTAAWLCFAIPAALVLYPALHRLLRWQRARMSQTSAS